VPYTGFYPQPRRMFMNVTLRPATKADSEFARSVHHRAYHDVVVRQFGVWDEATQDKFFQDGWNNPGHEIVYFDGVPCGYVRYERLEDEIRGHELVLLPEYQGKGIGSFLLSKMIQEATEHNFTVTLQVLTKNRASELYLKLGFKKVGHTDTHTLMRWQAN